MNIFFKLLLLRKVQGLCTLFLLRVFTINAYFEVSKVVLPLCVDNVTKMLIISTKFKLYISNRNTSGANDVDDF